MNLNDTAANFYFLLVGVGNLNYCIFLLSRTEINSFSWISVITLREDLRAQYLCICWVIYPSSDYILGLMPIFVRFCIMVVTDEVKLDERREFET